eukprot:6700941-Ditylum_brightwellii.AAC.1
MAQHVPGGRDSSYSFQSLQISKSLACGALEFVCSVGSLASSCWNLKRSLELTTAVSHEAW